MYQNNCFKYLSVFFVYTQLMFFLVTYSTIAFILLILTWLLVGLQIKWNYVDWPRLLGSFNMTPKVKKRGEWLCLWRRELHQHMLPICSC